jgi:hypothetical protein
MLLCLAGVIHSSFNYCGCIKTYTMAQSPSSVAAMIRKFVIFYEFESPYLVHKCRSLHLLCTGGVGPTSLVHIPVFLILISPCPLHVDFAIEALQLTF